MHVLHSGNGVDGEVSYISCDLHLGISGVLQEKSIELAKALHRHKISVTCVQDTKWVGAKAKEIDGYELWYSSFKRATNGVGILVRKEMVEQVVEVMH